MSSPGGRTALITDVTGQDGGYLAEQLLAEGVAVHGVVQAGEDVPPWLDGCSLHEADVLSDDLPALLAELQPDEVYNLAGLSSVALPWEKGPAGQPSLIVWGSGGACRSSAPERRRF